MPATILGIGGIGQSARIRAFAQTVEQRAEGAFAAGADHEEVDGRGGWLSHEVAVLPDAVDQLGRQLPAVGQLAVLVGLPDLDAAGHDEAGGGELFQFGGQAVDMLGERQEGGGDDDGAR